MENKEIYKDLLKASFLGAFIVFVLGYLPHLL